MLQQRLKFTAPISQDTHAWVHHRGTEPACSRLALWLIHGGLLWLNSSNTAGKSHLLKVLYLEQAHLGLVTVQSELSSIKQVSNWLEVLTPYANWAIDLPAGPLPHHTGLALFHLIERAKQMNRPLLISWRCPDQELGPIELASRMRMLEQLQLQSPDCDEDLKSVLQACAKQLHWDIPEALLKVMLTYLSRDLSTQINALHHLESASIEERARLSQTWARNKLQV
ncbi:MAG: hypothetical protein R8K49_04010 [Mariprofundaceae bacterium]